MSHYRCTYQRQWWGQATALCKHKGFCIQCLIADVHVTDSDGAKPVHYTNTRDSVHNVSLQMYMPGTVMGPSHCIIQIQGILYTMSHYRYTCQGQWWRQVTASCRCTCQRQWWGQATALCKYKGFCIQCLIADVHARDNDGAKPLHYTNTRDSVHNVSLQMYMPGTVMGPSHYIMLPDIRCSFMLQTMTTKHRLVLLYLS